MCMYYVMKEAKRVIVNGVITATYDPSRALMVCDDIVAADKYFRYCVNRKKMNVVLVVESHFHPAGNQTMRNIFNVRNEYGSGFEIIASVIMNGDSMTISQHSSKYLLENYSGEESEIKKMDLFDAYKMLQTGETTKDGKRIVAEIMPHRHPNGRMSRRIYNLRMPRTIKAPFETEYHGRC